MMHPMTISTEVSKESLFGRKTWDFWNHSLFIVTEILFYNEQFKTLVIQVSLSNLREKQL